ncbi:MAG: recombination mediator RecR [Candidatus Magasanikbacteria bacterium]|nr:recombination mediator RecR [Candidatus Magasanikbacteria bacterium]
MYEQGLRTKIMYPQPIHRLKNALKKLPGVGHRTAERYIFYLLKSGKGEVAELINALNNVIQNVKSCQICWDFGNTDPCSICMNPKKDRTKICVVAESQHTKTILNTTKYNGLFHVLRGTLSSEVDNLEQLKIESLLKRIIMNPQVNEIILALNPDLEGETTILYLSKKIHEIREIKITRLARGLPMGSDMLYADDITLSNALDNRTVS